MTAPTNGRSALPDGFAVLHVANDDAVPLRAARGNDPGAGRVAVRVRPGIRRIDWLARDLLAGLGVDFTVSGAGRNADENLQLLPVRLIAQNIADILIDAAEQLTAAMLTDLVLLAAAARVRLWLITTPPVTDAITAALADWCATEIPLADATDAWPGLLAADSPADASLTGSDAAPAADGDAEPRQLPGVDATTLLATARAHLLPAQAAWLHARLTAAAGDAAAQLRTAGADPHTVVAGWLLDRYDSTGTLTQFVTDVRAMQIAALWQGLLVQVDIPALLGTASGAPSAAARTPEVWQRLRAYRLPVRAAACALAGARLSATEACGVTLAGTAADGATVTVDGRIVPIEPEAATYVAEQRLLRLAHGVPEDATLLAGHKGQPLTEKALARLFTEARTELGLVVTGRLVERAAPDPATTLRRWGVTVTPIGEPVPGRPDPAPRAVTAAAPAAPVAAPTPLLDEELIRRRKAELRLTRRDVAKHLGVSTAVVGRLESGVNHGEQPLALLLRLAELLALDLADLLPRQVRRAPLPGTTASDATAGHAARDDARRLGAALHAVGVLVPAETLAQVLDWDAARLDAAATALTAAAPAAGLRVHRLYNRISLVRDVDALPADALAAVLRHDAARTGLSTTQATLVHAALTRAVTPAAGRGGRHMLARSNADKVAAAALVGAGILTTDDNGDLALSGDAAVSLLVPGDNQ